MNQKLKSQKHAPYGSKASRSGPKLQLQAGKLFSFKVLALSFAFCVLVLTLPQAADATFIIQRPLYIGLTDGLVGYWSFDGPDMAGNKAFDRSGQGNDGTLASDGPKRAAGKIGQALSFPGVNGKDVVIANEANFDFDNSDPFSISAWIKSEATPSERTIFVKAANSGNFPGYMFRHDTTNDRIVVRFIGTDGDNFGVFTGANTARKNVWLHVVATYSGSGIASGVKIHINGVLRATGGATALTSSILNNANPRIGDWHADGGDPFRGLIDEVRIYNRVLSPEEIRQLYNMGR